MQKLSGKIFFLMVLAFFTIPATAQTEPPVIRELYDTFAELNGERPQHGSLEISDNGAITLTDVKILIGNFQRQGIDIRQEIEIKQAVLRDITEISANLFRAGTVSLNNVILLTSSPEGDTFRIAALAVELTGAIIRGAQIAINGPLGRWGAQQVLAETTSVPLLTATFEQFEVNIHDFATTWKGDPQTGLGQFGQRIGSIVIPATILHALGPASIFAQLGYEEMNIGWKVNADMSASEGLLDVKYDGEVAVDKMGRFSVAGQSGDITPQIFETIQLLEEGATSLDIRALTAMLTAIKVSELEVTYEDLSLVKRFFDLARKQSGITRQQQKNDALARLDAALANTASPQLLEQIKQAVGSFIINLGWIKLHAQPPAPISMDELAPISSDIGAVEKAVNLSISSGSTEAAE